MYRHRPLLQFMEEYGMRSGSMAEAAPADGKTYSRSTAWAVGALTLTAPQLKYYFQLSML